MEDENDQEDICLRTCMEVMKRPSFGAAQKDEMIKKCALINPLYGVRRTNVQLVIFKPHDIIMTQDRNKMGRGW